MPDFKSAFVEPGPDDTVTNEPIPAGPKGKLVNPSQEQIGAVGELQREDPPKGPSLATLRKQREGAKQAKSASKS